ncbi:NUDIX domain-containing protein [candidate division FCPU426 bacterium]|nr:NUDIX domain-containing protein [candidate division FCPU426 bacterium]
MPRIRVAGMAVAGGKILLVKHRRAGREYYLLPGGGLEWGETCTAGLTREFAEELSLDVGVGPLLFINESIEPSGRRHIVNFTFLVHIRGGRLKLHPDRRLREARWVDRQELLRLTFYPEIRRPLLRAWKNKFKGATRILATPWNASG